MSVSGEAPVIKHLMVLRQRKCLWSIPQELASI
jgi:hypothetical protein